MKSKETMKDLAQSLGTQLIPVKTGELFEVKVIQNLKNKILVDVGGLTVGFIPEQEFTPDMGELKPGDKLLAYVLTVENDEGYVVLSLKRADKERISRILREKYESGEILPVKATDANKGGLLCQFGDYEGFLPVSQLAASHYPKVASGNRDEIFARLKSLVGQTFQVKVLSFEQATGKLIFSEKAAGDVAQQEKIKDIKIGEVFEGEITGIVDFGLFMKLKVNKEEVEGLVHISEVSWEHVADLKSMFQIGQKIKAQVISTEGNRLSLSLKRLEKDPWEEFAAKNKIGDTISAEVTKVTPYGAFVKADKVDGLIHISELGEKVENPEKIVEQGKSYKFKILTLDPAIHRLSLTLKTEAKEAKPKKETSAKKKTVAKKTVKKGAK